MSKRTDQGFSVIEILLIIVVVALLALVGWSAWSSRDDVETSESTETAETATNDEATNEETAEPEDITTDRADTVGWKSFTDYTKYGLSWKYPSDWGIKTYNTTQSNATQLTSPDYVEATDTASAKGGDITIDQSQYSLKGSSVTDLTAENFKTEFLDKNPNKHSNYRLVTVNGETAVQYSMGDGYNTVFFVAAKNNESNTSTFTLYNPKNSQTLIDTYNQIVGTVVLGID